MSAHPIPHLDRIRALPPGLLYPHQAAIDRLESGEAHACLGTHQNRQQRFELLRRLVRRSRQALYCASCCRAREGAHAANTQVSRTIRRLSRNTATAASRRMVGKWSRITSSRSPAARFAKRTSIGVEVPSQHGCFRAHGDMGQGHGLDATATATRGQACDAGVNTHRHKKPPPE